MPRHKRDAHLYEFAKRGAEVRFRELVQEVKYLVELFPHVRDSFDSDELPLPFIMARDAGRLTRKPRRTSRQPRMSAAARKAVSQRMKRYWAARRKSAKT